MMLLLVIVASVTLLGVESRRGGPSRCALDGIAIDPVYRVRIVEGNGRERVFCCVRCAQLWLAHADSSSRFFVTDESRGEEIPADEAWFVRSSVITQNSTRNRIHCFKYRADAERHAAAARGRVLSGNERPFRE